MNWTVLSLLFGLLLAFVHSDKVANYAADPYVRRVDLERVGGPRNNCFRVRFVTYEDKPADVHDKLLSQAKAQQFNFVENENDFDLVARLQSLAPPFWVPDFLRGKRLVPEILTAAHLSSISKWSCGRNLLKIGTGGSSDPLDDEISRGVGGFIKYCEERVRQPLMAQVCFVYMPAKTTNAGVDEKRVSGEIIDVESLEWMLRCERTPANHIIPDELARLGLPRAEYGDGESDLELQTRYCANAVLRQKLANSLATAKDIWAAAWTTTPPDADTVALNKIIDARIAMENTILTGNAAAIGTANRDMAKMFKDYADNIVNLRGRFQAASQKVDELWSKAVEKPEAREDLEELVVNLENDISKLVSP